MKIFDSCKFYVKLETYKLLTRAVYRYDAPRSPEAAWLEASRNLEYRTQSKDGERSDFLSTCAQVMKK